MAIGTIDFICGCMCSISHCLGFCISMCILKKCWKALSHQTGSGYTVWTVADDQLSGESDPPL